MDSLSSNPSGSGIYGAKPDNFGPQEALNLVFQLRDRENRDFKDKANFMSDLSLKQDRMRNLFNPDNQQQNPQKMNTVIAQDPNMITELDRRKLDMSKQGLDLDKKKLEQQGKLGQEALDIKGSQQQLNQQKSDQINATKQADMQRKIDESTKKFDLLQADLDRKTKSGEDTLQLRRDLSASVEERHKLEMAQKDSAFIETKKIHDAQIKKMEEDAKNASGSETTTEINADGTKKTVITKKGQTKRIGVIGPNGESGTIEEDDTLPTGWKKK